MESIELADVIAESEEKNIISSKNHAIIKGKLTTYFSVHYQNEYLTLPQLSLELSNQKVTPDISIFPQMEYNWLQDEIRLTTPPIIAIEILSPKQSLDDLTDKISIYLSAGVKSYWVIIPTFRALHIIYGNNQTAAFLSGKVKDPATNIEIDLDVIFR
ncbi:MAG: Uma2 family endonuclease [Thermoflexibacter sp.]|jgi:Uma2 family endonuclease|nr:Uma2 family endonuclease [Thermoflexibacter sp.]